MQQYRGIIEGVIFRNEETGYSVLALRTDFGESFTVVGIIPFAEEGDFISVDGEWVHHGSYGRQFRADSFSFSQPGTRSELEKYLGSGLIKGIGSTMAQRIIRSFGDKTIEIMDKDPSRLLEVEGIGRKKLADIMKSYNERRDAQNTVMHFLHLGLSPSISMRIYSKYGSDSILVSQRDPYRLADEIRGIGFLTADRIAFSMGFKPNDERRLASGIKYVLTESIENEGHTCLPVEVFNARAAEILNVEESEISRTAQQLAMKGDIVFDGFDRKNYVFTRAVYECECDIALRITALRTNPDGSAKHTSNSVTALPNGLVLSDKQIEALQAALKNRVTVITGGPGTGKTTLIRGILECTQGKNKIVLTAPTGRAAKRMSEATSHEAMTIHRLLEYGQNADESFSKNESNPIAADLIIVDESSMIDVFLMRALLRALRPDARIVFIGDSDQLPSVGAGNVLKDMINSSAVPVIKLTDIFRQSAVSDIVLNAHRINSGLMPVVNTKGSDFFLERCDSASEAAKRVVDLVRRRLPGFIDLNPVKDIQVIAPMKKGEAGVLSLNVLLQSSLNPPGDKPQLQKGSVIFRLGDKVMQTRNDYSICWTKGTIDGKGIYNGDMGYIAAIDEQDKQITVRFDDDREAVYDREMLEDLDLAYCMSVHKSQGCEFPCIVLPLVGGPPMLLTRNLLYTAITRARKLVVIVGRESCIAKMVENNHLKSRYSALCNRIMELNQG